MHEELSLLQIQLRIRQGTANIDPKMPGCSTCDFVPATKCPECQSAIVTPQLILPVHGWVPIEPVIFGMAKDPNTTHAPENHPQHRARMLLREYQMGLLPKLKMQGLCPLLRLVSFERGEILTETD